MRFLGEATDLAEGYDVRQKTDDKQPGIALHRQYDAESENSCDYEISNDGPKQFHAQMLLKNRHGASWECEAGGLDQVTSLTLGKSARFSR